MSFKIILKAATRLKNLALLAIIVGVYLYTDYYLPFLLVGAAGYIYFIMQTIKDESFLEDISKEQQIEDLRELSIQCDQLYNNIAKRLPGGMREKLKNIYIEKQSLVRYYSHAQEDPIKQKIVAQALKLVIVYFKLLHNYSIRSKDIYTVSVKKIEDRLSVNRRKKEYLTNPKAIADLEKAIELDERLMEKINNDKNELEMVRSKMDYIESAIVTFKHQIISNSDSDPEISEIDNVVNEAMSLDNVLSNRNNKMRL